MPRYPRDHFVDRWYDNLFVSDPSEEVDIDSEEFWQGVAEQDRARAASLVEVGSVFADWLTRPGVGPARVLDVVIAFAAEARVILAIRSDDWPTRLKREIIRAVEQVYIALLPYGHRFNISLLMIWDTFLGGSWGRKAPISLRREMERVLRHAADITTYYQARVGLLYGLSFWGYPAAEAIVERVRTNGRRHEDVEYYAGLAIERIGYGGYSALLYLPGQGTEQAATSGEL